MDQRAITSIHGQEEFVRTRMGSRVRAIFHPSSIASPRRFLLVHGNPASLEDWDKLVPLLSPTAELIRIDLPGFGQSTRPPLRRPSDLSLPRLAEVVLDVADHFGWTDPFVVVGHSHGGGVAQVLAAEHADRVQGIVLFGTLAFPVHLNYRLLPLPGVRPLLKLGAALLRRPSFSWATRAVVRQVLKSICSPEHPSQSQVSRELDRLTKAPESLVSMVDVSTGRPCLLLRQLAPKIRCKTLIIHGADDAVVPDRCARSLYAELSSAGGHAQLQVLPNAGHMLAYYQAEACADLISAFIEPLHAHPNGTQP